jgi:iron complex outermembrane receptor protein
VALALASDASAQNANVRVEVRSGRSPVAGASVVLNGTTYTADPQGVVLLTVGAGSIELVVIKEGLAPASLMFQLGSGESRTIIVELEPQSAIEEQVTVSATRTDRRLEDEPMRVEVLAREEIEEKMMMTPGDIVMTLNEMGGMRVQATSPSLGAASVRIQGMRGRYTRFLADGLPLFGQQVSGLGLLQIPPVDLGQVEVIKGVASALYGGGAMGGVVNLITRHPPKERVGELLLNRSMLGATDTVFWGATPLARGWSLSMLAGGHGQEQRDIDDDGWSDLPYYARAVVRPRLFWDGGNGRTLFATVGTTFEKRHGGTMDDVAPPVIGTAYREGLETSRVDAGIAAQTLVRGRFVVTGRAAIARQRHTHQFGEVAERDRHHTLFGELSARTAIGRHTVVAGAALDREAYQPLDVPRFRYTFTVPGIFVQDEIDFGRTVALSASGRIDHHTAYGTFFSPRVSLLLRKGEWTARVSAGTGFFGPTFLVEETEAAGLTRLQVPAPLKAERGRSVSLDITRNVGPVAGTVTLFSSRVSNPLHVDRDTAFVFSNLTRPTENRGVELLGVLRREPVEATVTYTFVDAREDENGEGVDVPLTPRHSLASAMMVELPGRGRLGLEGYYTGRQRLEDNPYRAFSPGYLITGFLIELRFGRFRPFLNGENLTDVRQSRWNPPLRPRRAPDGRWTVDQWAPLEGRVLNGGIRVEF